MITKENYKDNNIYKKLKIESINNTLKNLNSSLDTCFRWLIAIENNVKDWFFSSSWALVTIEHNCKDVLPKDYKQVSGTPTIEDILVLINAIEQQIKKLESELINFKVKEEKNDKKSGKKKDYIQN